MLPSNYGKQSVQVHRAEVWTATTLSPTLRSNLYKRTEQKQDFNRLSIQTCRSDFYKCTEQK